jgi:hypothetical protein
MKTLKSQSWVIGEEDALDKIKVDIDYTNDGYAITTICGGNIIVFDESQFEEFKSIIDTIKK